MNSWGTLTCYDRHLHDLGITRDNRDQYKAHFKEKVLNHFITQEQNDGKNDIATHLWTWNAAN